MKRLTYSGAPTTKKQSGLLSSRINERSPPASPMQSEGSPHSLGGSRLRLSKLVFPSLRRAALPSQEARPGGEAGGRKRPRPAAGPALAVSLAPGTSLDAAFVSLLSPHDTGEVERGFQRCLGDNTALRASVWRAVAGLTPLCPSPRALLELFSPPRISARSPGVGNRTTGLAARWLSFSGRRAELRAGAQLSLEGHILLVPTSRQLEWSLPRVVSARQGFLSSASRKSQGVLESP